MAATHLLLRGLPSPHLLLGALTWDPQLRGILIVLAAVLLLPGSVALVLSTNWGAKTGVVLALTALSGWVLMLVFIWALYAPVEGMRGSSPSWQLREIVSGSVADHAATAAARDFPAGWRAVSEGSSSFSQAQAAANSYLTATTPSVGAEGVRFPAPFKTTSDFVAIDGYAKAGKDYLFRIGGLRVVFSIKHHKMFIKHAPSYMIVRVQPSLPSVTLAGAAATLPAADPTAPITSVVLERNDGSVREPTVLVMLASLLIFGVCLSWLHRHDKAVLRARGVLPPGPGELAAHR